MKSLILSLLLLSVIIQSKPVAPALLASTTGPYSPAAPSPASLSLQSDLSKKTEQLKAEAEVLKQSILQQAQVKVQASWASVKYQAEIKSEAAKLSIPPKVKKALHDILDWLLDLLFGGYSTSGSQTSGELASTLKSQLLAQAQYQASVAKTQLLSKSQLQSYYALPVQKSLQAPAQTTSLDSAKAKLKASLQSQTEAKKLQIKQILADKLAA